MRTSVIAAFAALVVVLAAHAANAQFAPTADVVAGWTFTRTQSGQDRLGNPFTVSYYAWADNSLLHGKTAPPPPNLSEEWKQARLQARILKYANGERYRVLKGATFRVGRAEGKHLTLDIGGSVVHVTFASWTSGQEFHEVWAQTEKKGAPTPHQATEAALQTLAK